MYTDPIADLLTRLRNAAKARHEQTSCPASKAKKEILRVMKEQNFIKNFEESQEGHKKTLVIDLFPGKELTLTRVSKPGQRIYKKYDELFPVLRGFGFSIISTSKGVMTGDQARKEKIGGELLCEAY